MKVLISDNLSAEGVEILKKGGLEVVVKTGMTPDELKKEIKDYDGLVIRSATKVTAEIVAAAKKLKVKPGYHIMSNHPSVRFGSTWEIRPAADLGAMIEESAERRSVKIGS